MSRLGARSTDDTRPRSQTCATNKRTTQIAIACHVTPDQIAAMDPRRINRNRTNLGSHALVVFLNEIDIDGHPHNPQLFQRAGRAYPSTAVQNLAAESTSCRVIKKYPVSVSKPTNRARTRGSASTSVVKAAWRIDLSPTRSANLPRQFAGTSIGNDFKRELLSLVEAVHAGAFDRADMNETSLLPAPAE